jgi:C4-dicarboxylate transporter DctM subunit
VEVFRAVLPWMAVTIVMLILVTYVPELSLFLPRLIMG